jgi:hypothetical protein
MAVQEDTGVDTLLSLASAQIWPHVLTVAHLKPRRVILLHSKDNESARPARRLKEFFDTSKLVELAALEPVSHDQLQTVVNQLNALKQKYDIKPDACIVNWTGGNKLMAIAAFEWAANGGMQSCYLERGDVFMRFSAASGGVLQASERLDAHLTDDIDPLDLLNCQLNASAVVDRGQRLVLSEEGHRLQMRDVQNRLRNRSGFLSLLASDSAISVEIRGDGLELGTAVALLKLGVKQVRKGLKLQIQSGTKQPHSEIDLIFIWCGRIWTVDCKDRMPATNLLRDVTGPRGVLGRLWDALNLSQIKVLREDLAVARELGGLRARVIAVRKAARGPQQAEFARANGIEIVLKNDLVNGLQKVLTG